VLGPPVTHSCVNNQPPIQNYHCKKAVNMCRSWHGFAYWGLRRVLANRVFTALGIPKW
jgi:hypothetical protein